MSKETNAINNDVEMRTMSVTYQFSAIGSVDFDVPANMTRDEALDYIKMNIDKLRLPDNWNYLDGSDELDEENCNFIDEE